MSHSISQAARDLIWVANSPLLLPQNLDDELTSTAQLPLTHSQIDDCHLLAFLKQRPTRRVGRYFESLVAYWLQHIRRLKIVAESQTISEGRRSIGELDFIFYDELQRLTHWEVAVKFYLHLPDTDFRLQHFVGPNSRDNLGEKTTRIFQHQLPLSQQHFPEVQIRQPFLKGRLFYSHTALTRPHHHQHLSPHHLQGDWYYHADFQGQLQSSSLASRFKQYERVKYSILEKPHWIADEHAIDHDPRLLSPEVLREKVQVHFAQSGRGLLVSQLAPIGDGYQEIHRFFVVADNWPNAQTPASNKVAGG